MKSCVLFFFWFVINVSSKVLNERERSEKAAYIQKLLNRSKPLEGRIRLYGGKKHYEGNVYIYHAGQWGAICHDSWSDEAAQVVCRHLNKTGGIATRGSQYGKAVKKFWMDDIVCDGTEMHISHCKFSGWGISDCEPGDAAGVICRERKETEKKELKRIYDVIDVDAASLRLVGGRDSNEGRVEIYHNGVWGSICPDGWTLYEAAAVCKHLALGFAALAPQTDQFGRSKVILSGVHCEGNETNLFQCQHKNFGDVRYPHQSGNVAAVVCNWQLADLQLDTTALERTAHLVDQPMYQLTCAMEENCLSHTAYEIKEKNPVWQHETRRLLRFTAASLNIGTDDFRPYLPKYMWQWHLCHMHYHSMEVFATFDILNSTGHRVAEGHKASFCLEDNTCLPGVEKKYSCLNYGDQGVSVNCSDVYHFNLDCQWVDVTDVTPGDYTFKVAVNPHAKVAEQSFHNNAARCNLRITESLATVNDCRLERP